MRPMVDVNAILITQDGDRQNIPVEGIEIEQTEGVTSIVAITMARRGDCSAQNYKALNVSSTRVSINGDVVRSAYSFRDLSFFGSRHSGPNDAGTFSFEVGSHECVTEKAGNLIRPSGSIG